MHKESFEPNDWVGNVPPALSQILVDVVRMQWRFQRHSRVLEEGHSTMNDPLAAAAADSVRALVDRVSTSIASELEAFINKVRSDVVIEATCEKVEVAAPAGLFERADVEGGNQ
jgi:hypothetical protein